jgi:hypothetical protein
MKTLQDILNESKKYTVAEARYGFLRHEAGKLVEQKAAQIMAQGGAKNINDALDLVRVSEPDLWQSYQRPETIKDIRY